MALGLKNNKKGRENKMKKKTKKKVRTEVNSIVDTIFCFFLITTFLFIGLYISWAVSTLLFV